MSDKRIELLEEIVKWQPKIRIDEEYLELAFFKIFVKFENFITDAIVKYATGEFSNQDKVKRRLEFSDKDHLKKTIRLDYLDTGKNTKELVNQLFKPENKITFFFYSEHIDFYEDMKA